MKIHLSIVLGCFGLLHVACAQNAVEIFDLQASYVVGRGSPQAAALSREVGLIISQEAGLGSRIESERARAPVHDALLWAAARHVAFDQQAFVMTFPSLTEYAHVLLVSPRFFKVPRIIYQLPGDATLWPRMLYGVDSVPSVARVSVVEKWDHEGLADWIGNFTFENTAKGPYLMSELIGRETTGATTTRHVLGWIRIEPDRLVPERFEGYDVPIGQKRSAAFLTATALPLNPLIPGDPTQVSKDQHIPSTSQQSSSKALRDESKSHPDLPAATSSLPNTRSTRVVWILIAAGITAGLAIGWVLRNRSQ